MLARTVRPAACALLATLAGCAEEPSFQLGWRITTDTAVTEPEDAPALITVKQCAEVGIEKVRLEARGAEDPTGVPLRFVHEYACFHAAFGNGDAIDGPTLPPGDYELELIGLRRNGAEWLCPGVDEDGLPIEVGCVRDQASVTVREGELPEVAFLLDAPVQCDDGIDNDRDGRVDGNDLACQFEESNEGFDAGLSVFWLGVEFLGNPLIEPLHVGIHDFRMKIDAGTPDEIELPLGLPVVEGQNPWRFPLRYERLIAGQHTLEIVGLDASDQELTASLTFDFGVDQEQGAYVQPVFSFGTDDFLAPVVQDLRVWWELDQLVERQPCGNSLLQIDEVHVRLHDEQDNPLPVTVVGGDPLPPMGDWSVFECSNKDEVRSAGLTWTETVYSLEFEARIGGTACWVGELPIVRPSGNSQMHLIAERVLDDEGKPPAACIECTTDADCQTMQTTLRCANNVCVDLYAP